MPTMSTTPSTRPERRGRLGEEPLGVGRVGGVAGPRDAADLVGDVVGEVRVEVDAEHPGPRLSQRVRRLAADALPGPDRRRRLAVEAQQAEVVGDLGVVGSRHAGPVRAGRRRRRRPWR